MDFIKDFLDAINKMDNHDYDKVLKIIHEARFGRHEDEHIERLCDLVIENM